MMNPLPPLITPLEMPMSKGKKTSAYINEMSSWLYWSASLVKRSKCLNLMQDVAMKQHRVQSTFHGWSKVKQWRWIWNEKLSFGHVMKHLSLVCSPLWCRQSCSSKNRSSDSFMHHMLWLLMGPGSLGWGKEGAWPLLLFMLWWESITLE